MISKARGTKKGTVGVEFAATKVAVAKQQNKQVMGAVEAIAPTRPPTSSLADQPDQKRPRGASSTTRSIPLDNATNLNPPGCRPQPTKFLRCDEHRGRLGAHSQGDEGQDLPNRQPAGLSLDSSARTGV
jgi:hypothetical protein